MSNKYTPIIVENFVQAFIRRDKLVDFKFKGGKISSILVGDDVSNLIHITKQKNGYRFSMFEGDLIFTFSNIVEMSKYIRFIFEFPQNERAFITHKEFQDGFARWMRGRKLYVQNLRSMK